MTSSDVAIVLGASGVFITSLVSAGISIAAFLRAGRIQRTVDGLGDKRVAMGVRAGIAEGHALGVADERADPQSPAGT